MRVQILLCLSACAHVMQSMLAPKGTIMMETLKTLCHAPPEEAKPDAGRLETIELAPIEDLRRIYDVVVEFYKTADKFTETESYYKKGTEKYNNIQPISCKSISYTVLMFVDKYGLRPASSVRGGFPNALASFQFLHEASCGVIPINGKFSWQIVYIETKGHCVLRTCLRGSVIDIQAVAEERHSVVWDRLKREAMKANSAKSKKQTYRQVMNALTKTHAENRDVLVGGYLENQAQTADPELYKNDYLLLNLASTPDSPGSPGNPGSPGKHMDDKTIERFRNATSEDSGVEIHTPKDEVIMWRYLTMGSSKSLSNVSTAKNLWSITRKNVNARFPLTGRYLEDYMEGNMLIISSKAS